MSGIRSLEQADLVTIKEGIDLLMVALHKPDLDRAQVELQGRVHDLWDRLKTELEHRASQVQRTPTHELAVAISGLAPDFLLDVAERAEREGHRPETAFENLIRDWLTRRLLAEDNPDVRVEVRPGA